MRILLLNPPFVVGKRQKFTLPPLGILYIAAVLKKNSYHSEVVDCNTKDWSLEKVADYIVDKNPDIVGMGIMTPQIVNTLKICKMVKEKNKDIKICLGGSHINSVGSEVFKFSDDVDFLLVGEGEYAFLDLVKNLKKDYSKVKNLIYREKGKVKINDRREPIKDLDELPFPDFSLVDIYAYKSPYVENYPMMPIIASRGCPFNCSFCDAHRTHGRLLRKRSPKNIVDEIEYNIKKLNVKHVAIKDSSFILDKEWTHAVCDELMKRKLKIKWNCSSRVDNIDIDVLKKIKKAGCMMISFGVESGSQTVLNNINKQITLDQVAKAFKMAKKVNLKTYGFFMIGNPGDNLERVKKTINFSKKLDPDLVAFQITEAYPGTELYDLGLKNKTLADPQWYMQGMDNYVGIVALSACLEYPDLTKKQQQILLKRAYREFYLRPEYVIKKLASIKNFKQLKDLVNAGLEVIQNV
ncbi:MAG: radical SAM protein [Nanoarchaeota archaeon]